MVNAGATNTLLIKTRTAREEADTLLRTLLDAKSDSERRLADLRQVDHLKHVTGRSALDNAIAATRRMIDTLDRSLGELRREPRPGEVIVLSGSFLDGVAVG